MSNNTDNSGGVGFATVLGIVFVTLKLVGYLTWSWVWVLAPFWILLAFVLAIMGFCILASCL